MLKEKVSFKKKPLLLDFFHTCPPESKSKSEAKDKSESKGIPESKAGFAKERLFVEQGNPTEVGNQPLSLNPIDTKKEALPEEAGFVTRTQEISFEDFLKLRPDKKTY